MLTTSSPERGAGRKSNETVWRRFGGSTRSIFSSFCNRVIYDGLDLLVRRRERCCVLGEEGLVPRSAGENGPPLGHDISISEGCGTSPSSPRGQQRSAGLDRIR
eukprot:gene34413-46173_t